MPKAVWAPVLFYTRPGTSLECLVIALGAVTESGQSQVIRICRLQTFLAIFGGNAAQISQMTDWTVASLAQHLEQRQSFLGWQPPIQGVELGSYQSVETPDLARTLSLLTNGFLLGRADWRLGGRRFRTG